MTDVNAAARSVGPTGISGLPKGKRTHLLRRFHLLGESLESGQVWDIRQAVEGLRSLPGYAGLRISLHGAKDMAVNVAYASLYLPAIAALELREVPPSHRGGPTYMNVLRFLDVPHALAMAAERAPLTLRPEAGGVEEYARQVGEALKWEARLNLSE